MTGVAFSGEVDAERRREITSLHTFLNKTSLQGQYVRSE